MKQTIKIPKAVVQDIQGILDKEELVQKSGTIIQEWTAKFDDHFEADIKIVATDLGAYIDAILFLDGGEVEVHEPGYTLLGEYLFEYDGAIYEVIVEEEP